MRKDRFVSVEEANNAVDPINYNAFRGDFMRMPTLVGEDAKRYPSRRDRVQRDCENEIRAGRSIISNTWLAKRHKCSLSTIGRYLKHFVEQGYFKIRQVRLGKKQFGHNLFQSGPSLYNLGKQIVDNALRRFRRVMEEARNVRKAAEKIRAEAPPSYFQAQRYYFNESEYPQTHPPFTVLIPSLTL